MVENTKEIPLALIGLNSVQPEQSTEQHQNTPKPAPILLDSKTIKARAASYSFDCIHLIKTYGLASATRFAVEKGISEPKGSPKSKGEKLKCVRWWSRKLRNANQIDAEEYQRSHGYVGKQVKHYASEVTVKAYRAAKEQSEINLKKAKVINKTTGEVFSLWDIHQSTVSNPEIRRAELMVRIKGTEELAKEAGYSSVFLTITAPSKFHASSKKWNSSTVKEAQKHLTDLWENCRKEFNRFGINPFGVRVSEPHKDGTPHWHLLAWCKPDQETKLLEIVEREAFKVDGSEAGASEHRFKVERIDENKGSAVSYIAKYISKNVDGHGLESDEVTNAERVRAWASLYGIRQFQFFGLAGVGEWRMLRKMPKQDNQELENVRLAAIEGDYAAYLRFQGGLGTTTRTQRLKLIVCDAGLNAYYEPVTKVCGIALDGEEIELDRDEWVIDFQSEGGAETPWSPLNNYQYTADQIMDIEHSFVF